MHTEHSVVYGEGGSTERIVTREVFTSSDGRILGTETQERRWFEGDIAGWKWFRETTQTCHFETLADAASWVDAMIRAHQVWNVARKGGTRLVILNA